MREKSKGRQTPECRGGEHVLNVDGSVSLHVHFIETHNIQKVFKTLKTKQPSSFFWDIY